jgi:polysaccharide export outer membrane protein
MLMRFFVFALALAALVPGAVAIAASVGELNYRLAAGDEIRVTLFGEPDLTVNEVRLTEAGVFSFPFLGLLKAEGMTAPELERMIADRLRGDYLVDPRVTVSVLKYREFYISGEVSRTGAYPYQTGLTVRRATALAGGLTERASERRITIIREGAKGSEPERANMDTEVRPGDTISIGQGFF